MCSRADVLVCLCVQSKSRSNKEQKRQTASKQATKSKNSTRSKASRTRSTGNKGDTKKTVSVPVPSYPDVTFEPVSVHSPNTSVHLCVLSLYGDIFHVWLCGIQVDISEEAPRLVAVQRCIEAITAQELEGLKDTFTGSYGFVAKAAADVCEGFVEELQVQTPAPPP